ncbi:MAG: multidrug resistance efflux transporter family protein [Desulfovibrionaceae bacterium]
MKIVVLGVLAALFFSSTFVLNRAMSLGGGHWVWAASLRYAWMLAFLCGGLGMLRPRLLQAALRLFAAHWAFWTVAGSIGFGVFYALITFSASYAPGWVVATTWQSTILASPLVLLCFGRRVPARALLLTLVVFAGVVLVNAEQAETLPWSELLLGALPVFAAAFAYPLGNQLVWETGQGRGRLVPRIDDPAMADPFCRVLLLTLGSVPLWIGLVLACAPPPPTPGQLASTAVVALCSGIAATSLFLSARHAARTPAQLAAVDSTQSMEVVFALGGEMLLLGGAAPGLFGWLGLGLTVAGLVLYVRAQSSGARSAG